MNSGRHYNTLSIVDVLIVILYAYTLRPSMKLSWGGYVLSCVCVCLGVCVSRITAEVIS